MKIDIPDADIENLVLFSKLSNKNDKHQLNIEKVRVSNVSNIFDSIIIGKKSNDLEDANENECFKIFEYFVKFIKLSKGE